MKQVVKRKQVTKGKSVIKSERDLLVPGKNGGMIRRGSLPGNTPGTGRPPNALRDSMRGDLDKLLPELWRKYEAHEIDALEFANFLAKYGLGTKDETTIVSADVTDRLKRQVEVIASRESWTSEELLSTIGPIWTTTKG